MTVAQQSLFEPDELPDAESQGEVVQSLYVHFESAEDLFAFGERLGVRLTTQTRWLEWPIPDYVASKEIENMGPSVAQPQMVDVPILNVERLLEEAQAFCDHYDEHDVGASLVKRLASALGYAWSALHPESDDALE